MSSTAVEDFLTCAICLETFKDPVSLSCHHSFCRSCLESYWDQKKTRTCPVCTRRSSKETLWINFPLKELCVSFCEEKKTKALEKDEIVCFEHPDVAPTFCREDDYAFCSICEIKEHKNHTLETVEMLKEQTESDLKCLKAMRDEVIEEEKEYEEIRLHSEKQEQDCERHIKALFERLQQFLLSEQKRALSRVREEKQIRTGIIGTELERVRGQLSSLSKNIQRLERQLQRGAAEFVTQYKRSQRQMKIQRAQKQPPPRGLLLNQAEILGNLGYRVWERMKSVVQRSPVILDPNTANRSLHLSDDLTRVGQRAEEGSTEQGRRGEDGSTEQALNQERFTNMAAVLGSKGFTSGTHEWDVEVGDHPHWVIGVAKESIERQEKANITPEYGIWCLWHGEGGYTNGTSNAFNPVEKCPGKIRVKLDVDSGKVSFFDAEDMVLLCMHKDKFNEKLFPLFSVGMAGEAKTTQLQICGSAAL